MIRLYRLFRTGDDAERLTSSATNVVGLCFFVGSGGLPSLLALQVQQHNLVGAMAVLQTAWQLTNPAALCRPEQQNPTSQAPATGRGDDLFTFQPPLRTATDRSTNVASRPKQNELVSSELCELIQVRCRPVVPQLMRCHPGQALDCISHSEAQCNVSIALRFF